MENDMILQVDYRNENDDKDLHGTMTLDMLYRIQGSISIDEVDSTVGAEIEIADAMMLQIDCYSDNDDKDVHGTINNDDAEGTLTLHVNQAGAYNEIFCTAFNGTGMFSSHAMVTKYVIGVCELSKCYVPKLRRRGDGIREPRAKEASSTWRLGETRLTS
jgi:hypothetical protein